VQIGTGHLQDHIEWDLLSPLTPEAFAQQLCAELGLAGEAIPLVAHAVHEELLKHTRDAFEWGVLGGAEPGSGGADDSAGVAGVSVLKDRTGLGLGWGKAPKDGRGRGPKTLKSVWRDWAEAEEFATRFEPLTPEEVERREMERERATRYVGSCCTCAVANSLPGDSAERRPSSRVELEGGGDSHEGPTYSVALCGCVRDGACRAHNISCTSDRARLGNLMLCTCCIHFKPAPSLACDSRVPGSSLRRRTYSLVLVGATQRNRTALAL
jgi:hypothetical protein